MTWIHVAKLSHPELVVSTLPNGNGACYLSNCALELLGKMLFAMSPNRARNALKNKQHGQQWVSV